VSSLSITFQTLQPSEFVIFVVTGYREFVCYSEFPWQIFPGCGFVLARHPFTTRHGASHISEMSSTQLAKRLQ
jgi:hypothetical protein